MTDEHAK
jgi:hypothetical protein